MGQGGGARPARDAACLPESVPSSGISVRTTQADTVALPEHWLRFLHFLIDFHPAKSPLEYQIAGHTTPRSPPLSFSFRASVEAARRMPLLKELRITLFSERNPGIRSR